MIGNDAGTLLTQPASELRRRVAAGEMSAADLVRAHLARIDHISHLNAFVDVRADAALAEAAAQDEAAARRVPRGVLGGLPVTVKSAIEVRGLRCETGSPSRRGRLAARDAVVVSRLRQAGAIVIGTTNVAEMLMGYDTDNPLHSLTRNPWNVAKTPGGSSGGEAAAIATGASAAGIGSDGGGSIRVPAHVSGICGFKPTPGRVPATSHQPACLGPFSLIGVVGPMARTVGDLELLDRVLSGYDPGDPMSMPLHDARQEAAAFAAKPLRRASPEPWRRRDGTRQEEVRVAFFEDDGVVPVTPETRAAVRRAARIWEVFFAEVALLALHEELGGAERELPILRSYLERPPICVSVPSVAESVPSVPESV